MLAPHLVRLRPRCDVTQTLHQFSLEVSPIPAKLSETIDLDGNAIVRVWFPEDMISVFSVKTIAEVETFRTNPFDFLLEPWATQLPINYPSGLLHQLQPYLGGYFIQHAPAIDPIAAQLAQEIWSNVSGNTINFLTDLNQRIYNACGYRMREHGAPLPPGLTWTKQEGSCRDFAVLFMEVCRSVGLAARFVSGYQEGDPDGGDRELHGWAEVYLPGAGWRGYDPTHGLAVADRHIALVATPSSSDAAPISGTLKLGTGTQSKLQYQISVHPLSADA